MVSTCNYPPEEIIKPIFGKPNYEFIILWILNNNEVCTWANLKEKVKHSTLSIYLSRLKERGYIDKSEFNQYKITTRGKDRYYELSEARQKKRKLSYPPDAIRRRRNYDHWILWMVYNNTFCKRSDFLEVPLSINQSSLSKNLSLLIDKGFIIKEDGKYIITQAGKSEYSRILENYDLDRQTILEEESKRIEGITNRTTKFFDKYKIKDKDIQFRFLNNVLKLDYDKVKPLLNDEEVFYKILLFLSLNHPDQYPNFISSADFSKMYMIKKTTLDYYIDEISEGKIYPLRFFKLIQPSGEQYYFQSDGALERILRVITENEINKVAYLNKLFSKPTPKVPIIDMKPIINDIVDKSCEFLFEKDLNTSLREFLPEYIRYLAYKIETRKELKETYDKLEGIIWQNITDIFQSQISGNLREQFEEQVKEIDKKIELNPENLDLYYMKIKILIYFNQYQETIKLLDKLLGTFPNSEKDIKVLKAAVLRRMQNVEAGLDIINDLIQKFPSDKDIICYKAYWMQYLDKKEEAIKIIKQLIKEDPENGVYQDTFGEILMYFEEYDEAAKKFLKAIVIGSDNWYIYQTYIKLGICYKALGNYDLARKNFKKGKDLTKKSSSEAETKQKWLSIADLFLLEIEQLF